MGQGPRRSVSSKSTSLNATIRDQSGAGKVKVGEILSKDGYITSTQLKHALDLQKNNHERLGSILLKLGYIEESTIVNVLSRRYNYPAVELTKVSPDEQVLKIIPYDIAKKYMAFPLSLKGEDLFITMAEPTDTVLIENLQKEVKKPLQVGVSTEKDIVNAYRVHYKIDEDEYESYFKGKEEVEEEIPVTTVDDFGSLVSEAEGDVELKSFREEENLKDEYLASDAPIIKLVNGILIKAINDGISDVHIEPFETAVQVRYRLDGALYKSMNLPATIKNALTSRIKILSGLDIAERRVPQDGRIKMSFGRKKDVDLRVSTLPIMHGESIVMRILDRGALNVDLTKLGFDKNIFDIIKRCIARPYGLLLVTGPTGSGKTTTLYSILNTLNKEDIKILTAEDPIEFNFRGINQVNVREKVGLTFAVALRAFLRQDPDVIMVGEIRDMETAEIAIKAATTGHLVFSTLHTNDSPSTISRMMDIGIPPYMLASSITMVLSQRLARKLCDKCKVEVDYHNPKELQSMGFSEEEIPDLKILGPQGCPACNQTGYKGRTGLYELMEVTDEVAKVINAGVPEDQLRKTALKEGMVTLRDAGLEKIRNGVTSVEEILKNTTITKEALPTYLVSPDTEEYNDREMIIREGNRDTDFFKLIQGSLIVVKGGKKIAQIVQPGEYFGEIAAITGEPRTASILSNKRSVVKRFPGDKLEEVIEKYPDVAKHLFEVLGTRLNQADKNLVKLISAKVKG